MVCVRDLQRKFKEKMKRSTRIIGTAIIIVYFVMIWVFFFAAVFSSSEYEGELVLFFLSLCAICSFLLSCFGITLNIIKKVTKDE